MAQARRRFYAPPTAGGADALSRLQRGTYGTGGEIMDKTLWDTIELDTNANVYRMFSIPEGQAGKTKDLTNMINPSQIAQGQQLRVKAIQICYISSAALGTADVQYIYDVLNHFTAEFIIPGKDNLGDWTLQELMGSSMLVALTPTAAGDNIPLVMPQFNGIRHLKVPIVLSALTTFEVKVTPHVASNAALDGDFIRIGLRGIMRRSS